jgi:hypothetical protein
MPDFGSFRGFGEKLMQGQTPTQLGKIGGDAFGYVGLLDSYSGASVAYSLRLLSALYVGNSIRVRRSSDNAEQDIGFNGANLDTAALTSFCGSGNGFVTTWYDQSGNSRNATQTTAAIQPQIVSSGNVILANTKPTLDFLGGLNGLNFAQFSASVIDAFILVKTKSDPATIENSGFIKFGTDTLNNHFPLSTLVYDDFGSTTRKSLGDPTTSLAQLNIYNVLSKSGEWTARLNTVSIFSTSSNIVAINSAPKIGSKDGSIGMMNYIPEFIIYPSDQTSNRTGISTNINTYYAIY